MTGKFFHCRRGLLKRLAAIIAAALALAILETAAPAKTAGAENAPAGRAMRPLPLLMPMDYAGARAQAWLNAIAEAAARLPAATGRRLADLGLSREQTGGDAPIKALASLLFPVDVVTPQLSSSREILVYLQNPEDYGEFSRFFANEETLALGAALILETEKEVEELAGAWPASLDEARPNTAALEARAAALAALWRARTMYGPDRKNSIEEIGALAAQAPQSLFLAYLYAEALLSAQNPQECLQETGRILDGTAGLAGESRAIWTRLRPRIRHIRAMAQRQLNQHALAEDDLDAAIREAAGLPAQTRANLLAARGNLKRERKNEAGMCEDFASACALGFCDSLARARRIGLCSP